MQRFKAAGAVLGAVLAISGLLSPAASAGSFTSSAEVTSLVAGQVATHEIVTNLGVLICNTVHFTSEQLGTTVEVLELLPAYYECEIAELFELTVSVNNCLYVLHASSTTEGNLDIAGCNESVPYIQYGSLLTCRVRIQEQSEKGSIKYEDTGNDLAVNFKVEGLEYTEAGAFCKGSTADNGTYHGTSEVEGNGGAANLGIES